MMKFTYSLALFIAFLAGVNGQEIPNGNFEEWEILQGVNTEFPTGWITSNFSGAGAGLMPNAEKTTDAKKGNYAIKLTTVDGFDADEPLVGAALYDGALDNTPTELRGYYKTSLVGDDAAVITLDIVSGGDVIGIANIEFESNESGYTYFSAAIDYLVADPNAEWFYLSIYSSIDVGIVGSTLFIDGLNFDGITAISDLNSVKIDLVIAPNPVSELLNISVDNLSDNLDMTIYDTRGKIVEASQFNQNLTIDVSQYPGGQYFITLRNSLKKLVQTGNFVVIE